MIQERIEKRALCQKEHPSTKDSTKYQIYLNSQKFHRRSDQTAQELYSLVSSADVIKIDDGDGSQDDGAKLTLTAAQVNKLLTEGDGITFEGQDTLVIVDYNNKKISIKLTPILSQIEVVDQELLNTTLD